MAKRKRTNKSGVLRVSKYLVFWGHSLYLANALFIFLWCTSSGYSLVSSYFYVFHEVFKTNNQLPLLISCLQIKFTLQRYNSNLYVDVIQNTLCILLVSHKQWTPYQGKYSISEKLCPVLNPEVGVSGFLGLAVCWVWIQVYNAYLLSLP